MLPASFTSAVGECFGDTGRRWLATLPARVRDLLRDWDLTPAGPLPLSLNYVIRVRRADGTPAVLKLGVPEAGHIADEATTLEFFGGRGAVRLLASDDERGALLLEEAFPGTPAAQLSPTSDPTATAALIRVVRRLHRPAPDGVPLPELSDRLATFAQHLKRFPGDDPLPRSLVERGARVFAELCATATGRVVLHGDLHHGNILTAAREPWLAIDPHGVIGDPGYEIGALLYNPNPESDDDTVLDLLPSRIEQLADGLAIPAERIIGWGFAQAVLSELWTATGSGKPGRRPLRVAHRLLPLLP
ncbi:hydroxyurea phosphotransferase [Actinoplanes sp. OR16]|uniref:aminoglycoside phosphotransferase family protein n=1 Tax=Actinoplanes sp. OR16 TaxID=946334 RepID=UPI000F6E78D0|nr:aminoglycoside phosphotransferase family protein [Actinoplanes sp. OR16]BBH63582.1 hydroxyurea phosphotransferase [Actinoplanes sp. OR16]